MPVAADRATRQACKELSVLYMLLLQAHHSELIENDAVRGRSLADRLNRCTDLGGSRKM